jgi:sortase A
MDRARSSRVRFSLVVVLSLGALALGIGLIGWASMSIWAQSVPSVSPIVLTVNDASVTPSPDKPLYPVRPAEGDTVGSPSIPVLKQTLPIIEGTSTDDLKRGVGHFTRSVLPGEKDNCVLSGHRDTVFAKLGKLKTGDQVIAQTSAGTFTYEIKGIRIVHADDRTVIVPADHAVLTLTTCYPFNYVGSAPDRYILTADLVVRQ